MLTLCFHFVGCIVQSLGRSFNGLIVRDELFALLRSKKLLLHVWGDWVILGKHLESKDLVSQNVHLLGCEATRGSSLRFGGAS